MGDVLSLRGALPPGPPSDAYNWRSGLKCRRDGTPEPTLANAVLILQHSDEWQKVLAYDVQADRVRLIRAPPCLRAGRELPTYWNDSLTRRARVWFDRLHRITLSDSLVRDAVAVFAERDEVHPLQLYLRECGARWDGKPRVDTWLQDHLRVADSPYVRAVGAKWLLSAVARAMTPGCQADYMLIVEGPQRAGKSSAFLALMPDKRWIVTSKLDLRNKDSRQIVEGRWIVVFEEFAPKDDNASKAFITDRSDTYCKRYARDVTDQPRSCILVGLTNHYDDYLTDPSGGERYWPVRTPATQEAPLDAAALEAARDQLWGEAFVRWQAGEAWHLTDPALVAAARAEQAKRVQRDEWEDPLHTILLHRNEAIVAELLQYLPNVRFHRGENQRVAACLARMGWEHTSTPERNGKRVKVYTRKSATPSASETEVRRTEAREKKHV